MNINELVSVKNVAAVVATVATPTPLLILDWSCMQVDRSLANSQGSELANWEKKLIFVTNDKKGGSWLWWHHNEMTSSDVIIIIDDIQT